MACILYVPRKLNCPQDLSDFTHTVIDVGTDNLVKERVVNNGSFLWSDGALNKMNLKAFDGGGNVGLQACFYDGPISNISVYGLGGIRLWVATGQTEFAQLSWRSPMQDWIMEQQWTDVDGHASPACYGWQRGQVDYVMFVDPQSTMNVYWYVS